MTTHPKPWAPSESDVEIACAAFAKERGYEEDFRRFPALWKKSMSEILIALHASGWRSAGEVEAELAIARCRRNNPYKPGPCDTCKAYAARRIAEITKP